MRHLRLSELLAKAEQAGLTPQLDFPARFRRRAVRVVELMGEYAMIQPIDGPRSWEIVPTELIRVKPNDLHSELGT